MTINQKLACIQSKLKAPKGQFNEFGKFKYRSCEDILEAVKPLLDGIPLTITDDLVLMGDRYYVKATVTLGDVEHQITTTAYAREEDAKKGMDASQITGAASSYARKYALNGLFLIDDTNDADAQEPEKEKEKPKSKATTPPPNPKLARPQPDDVPDPPEIADVAHLEEPKQDEMPPTEEPKASAAQIKRLFAIGKGLGYKVDELKIRIAAIINRQFASSKELTMKDMTKIFEALEKEGKEKK